MKEINISKLNLIEYIDDIIFILNNENKIEYLNEESLTKRLGYSKEDLINQSLIKISYSEDILELEKRLRLLLEKGNCNLEIRIKHKKGHYRWYSINGNIFFEHNQKKMILILKDITKFKKKEYEYKEIENHFKAAPELRFWNFLYPQKLLNAVERSQEMLKSIIDNIPQLIYWKDANLNYIGCNRNYALINGFENPIHVINRKDNELMWAKYKHKKIKSAEENVIINNRPEYNVIEDWILPNGNKVWYNINRIPLHNPDDKVIGIFTTYADITERFILEQKIVNSEKNYEKLHEKLKAGYFEIDFNGILRSCNNSFCEILGQSKKEILEKDLNLFVDKQTRGKLLQISELIDKKGGITNYIHKLRINDGKEIVVEISAYLKYNLDGEKVGYNGLIRNITDKYTLEKKLKESEEKYRNIINNISDIIFELDLETNFTYISPQCENIFGYPPKSLIGKNCFTFIHLEDISYLKNKLERKHKRNDTISVEFRIRNKEGNYLSLFVNASFVEINNRIRIIGVARDITEKRDVEKRIKESEENYRLITENVNDLISLINSNIRYEYINEVPHLKLLGYTKNDLIGKSIISFVHPDDKEIGIKKLRAGLQIGGGEFRVRHKDGHYIWMDVRAKIFKNKDDETKVIFISRDITERKKSEIKLLESEEELKKLNKDLEKKVLERTKELEESEKKLREQYFELQKLDQLKTNFLTMVSHELKTPLISIGGYTDYILTKYSNLDPEIIDDLNRVKNNVKRLGTYIEQLMDVLKIDAKKMEFYLEPTNLKKVILNCINELDYQIKKKKLNIEVFVDNELLLEVDASRILQVFTNLLSNAIKFTPKNGKIEISAKKFEKEDKCLIKVKDSGIGISQDQIANLFNKFVMLDKEPDNSSTFESGSGLGLYITKGIIEGHGGKIWVNSNGRGMGAEFNFTIPIQNV